MIPNWFYDVRSINTELIYYQTYFDATEIVSYGTAFILKLPLPVSAAAA